MTKKVKTSKHSLSELNFGKECKISSFISDYRDAVQFYIDYLWNNKITIIVKDQERTLDIKNDLLDCPQFISTTSLNFIPDLSGRALKCAATQACGLVSGAITKRRKLLFAFSKRRENRERTRKANKKLREEKLTKPSAENVRPELNSICCSIEPSSIKHFDTVITLSSLGKKYGKIVIPIKHTKHSRELQNKSNKMLTSILLSEGNINLRCRRHLLQ
jgi:hypothetical protein